MIYKKIDNNWIVVLKRGEKIIEKLMKFIEKENITSGYLRGIGAVSSIELAHFNLKEKRYSSKKIEEPLEIVSLIGNIAEKENEKFIHCHIAVGNDRMELYGGHLKEAIVSATCEVIVTPFTKKVKRAFDSDTGLFLLS
ncbi:MAG: hypothetical protein B5M53_05815 [Candidatus Cloacimonas sp. 4484_209]|nr:MAG: hypothetical protein B5M53_05815 [Candidatus Cloacimonas sp. 4484_209]